jgi:hypothetical protein
VSHVVQDSTLTKAKMMNIALTYDHRLIDGREAATFLVKVGLNFASLFTAHLTISLGQRIHPRPAENASWMIYIA